MESERNGTRRLRDRSGFTLIEIMVVIVILGLLAGTILTSLLGGFDSNSMAFPGNPMTTVVGGLLVGLGTTLGAGCTSGHGICGIARLSMRSIVSTGVFMFFAVATVYLMRHVIGAS